MEHRPRRATRSKTITYAETSDHEPYLDSSTQAKSLKPSNSSRSSSSLSSILSLDTDVHSAAYAPLEGEDLHANVANVALSNGRLHNFRYHTCHLSSPRNITKVPGDSTECDVRDKKVSERSEPTPVQLLQDSLLKWYDQVKLSRDMPWRKETQPNIQATKEQRGQRAYEVWVSEIMLQQTQVETVKSYYLRWMLRFSTIFDLAKANIEDVNECWQGLGYYSRASRLLSGAKKVVDKYDGVLPEDPTTMQKEVPGIGPYSAGAIASIAYGKSVPMVDGNIHRVVARMLAYCSAGLTALHAPQAAKSTTNFIWSVVKDLVPTKRPGDFNQALMELGATVCKPREALCFSCPLKTLCKAFQESEALGQISRAIGPSQINSPVEDIEDSCHLCFSFNPSLSLSSNHVLAYPMAKERKKSAVRETAVGVIEWQCSSNLDPSPLEKTLAPEKHLVLLIKRPEKGLLAGLWEFPSIDLPESNDSTAETRLSELESFLSTAFGPRFPPLSAHSTLTSPSSSCREDQDQIIISNIRHLPEIPHIFSHIKMTYKSSHVIIKSHKPPQKQNFNSKVVQEAQLRWIPASEVMTSNIGNPHKKVWMALTNTQEAGARQKRPVKRKSTRLDSISDSDASSHKFITKNSRIKLKLPTVPGPER